MRTLYAVIVAALLAVGLSAQTQQPTPEQQIAQLQRSLSQRVGQLGACHSELGAYQQQIAQGQLVTWAQVRVVFEQANPGKALDADLKVSDKAPPQKP